MQCSGPRSARSIFVAVLLGVSALHGCGFFDVDDDPDPLWGIWDGPYPTTLSTQADSARWIFSPQGIYLFYALSADGVLLHREEGYFHNSGIQLILSADPAGEVDAVELLYDVVADDLLLTIEGERYKYRRSGTAAEAREFGRRNLKPPGEAP